MPETPSPSTLAAKNSQALLATLEEAGLELVLTRPALQGEGWSFAWVENPAFRGRAQCLDDGAVELELRVEVGEDCQHKLARHVTTDDERAGFCKEVARLLRFMGFKGART